MAVLILVAAFLVDSHLQHRATNGDPTVQLHGSELRSIADSAFLIVAAPGIFVAFAVDKVIAKMTSHKSGDNRRNTRKKKKKRRSR